MYSSSQRDSCPFGARGLIENLFAGPNRIPCDIAPTDGTIHPVPSECGLPLRNASEPVNPDTGRRLVYFAKGFPPVAVLAEPKHRFIAVVFKGNGGVRYAALFGTVLGYSDDDTQIIWQNRSEMFASRIPIDSIEAIYRAMALQCRHCGYVLLREEIKEHSNTHRKGQGVTCGIFTNDPDYGNVCGDTMLVQSLGPPRRLAEGAQGVVSLCKVEVRPGEMPFTSNHLTNPLKEVVLKTIRFKDSTEALLAYQQSVRFLTGMSHPHLVEYLAVALTKQETELQIYMPYYEEGDLATKISKFTGNKFEEHYICSVALQLCQAVSFMHERNPPLVHGDIKVENIMIYNRGEQIVLMDLDASREVGGAVVKSSLGTASYMAPETMNKERLMPASDMWSVGVLLYVLMVLPEYPGMILNPNTNELEMFNSEGWATPEDLAAIEKFINLTNAGASSARRSFQKSTRNRISFSECITETIRRRGYSVELTQLVVDMLSYNPLQRPSATDAVGRVTEIMTSALLS